MDTSRGWIHPSLSLCGWGSQKGKASYMQSLREILRILVPPFLSSECLLFLCPLSLPLPVPSLSSLPVLLPSCVLPSSFLCPFLLPSCTPSFLLFLYPSSALFFLPSYAPFSSLPMPLPLLSCALSLLPSLQHLPCPSPSCSPWYQSLGLWSHRGHLLGLCPRPHGPLRCLSCQAVRLPGKG